MCACLTFKFVFKPFLSIYFLNLSFELIHVYAIHLQLRYDCWLQLTAEKPDENNVLTDCVMIQLEQKYSPGEISLYNNVLIILYQMMVVFNKV